MMFTFKNKVWTDKMHHFSLQSLSVVLGILASLSIQSEDEVWTNYKDNFEDR